MVFRPAIEGDCADTPDAASIALAARMLPTSMDLPLFTALLLLTASSGPTASRGPGCPTCFSALGRLTSVDNEHEQATSNPCASGILADDAKNAPMRLSSRQSGTEPVTRWSGAERTTQSPGEN